MNANEHLRKVVLRLRKIVLDKRFNVVDNSPQLDPSPSGRGDRVRAVCVFLSSGPPTLALPQRGRGLENPFHNFSQGEKNHENEC